MASWSAKLEGTLAGPYIVGDRLRVDSHAAIYSGRATIGEKRVELKFLSEEALAPCLRTGLGGSPLLQEYRVALQLGPSHVSRHIHTGYGAQGLPFLVRELPVDGGSIDENRVWGFRDATSLVVDVAEAVIAMHSIGVEGPTLHPSNLEVFPEGVGDTRRCRLRDLSWLRWQNLPTPSEPSLRLNTFSPEQAKGTNADVRTDVFNLGRLYYRLLTGVSAFEGYEESVETLRSLFLSDQALPTHRLRERRKDLFEEIDMFLVRVLHRSPEVRPETVQMFLSGVVHLVEVYEGVAKE